MSKLEFLRELSRRLSVLQAEEVRDILDEYEQHINMKMEEGQSEESAISDFGNVNELAAEILSAYHVKADFKEEKKSSKILEKVQDNSIKAMNSAGDAVKAAGNNVKSAGNKATGFIKNAGKKIWKIIKSPFVWIKKKLKREKKEVMTQEMGRRNFGSACSNMIKSVWGFLKRVFFGCLFVCFGAVEIGLLFAAGILLVLLVMGYPVIGATLIVTGSAMTFFAAAAVCGIKMRRRP